MVHSRLLKTDPAAAAEGLLNRRDTDPSGGACACCFLRPASPRPPLPCAVRDGERGKYDLDFVIAEVNADVRTIICILST